jgi:ATP-dependent Clp protease ATP-binding subunit ClpC
VVTAEHIAEVVSMWTGVPLVQLKEKEIERLLQMEEALHKRIIGQDEAIVTIAKAVRRGRAGLKDPRHPIGNFIFLGPTGVGKTELARVLAQYMFDDENALIRVDMSEFMEKFAVSRLVGAPPGYVGYEEGGQLTEKVRRKPYSVVLLDEIEKAHPDVFNILLQVLDDGQLTDSFKRRVNFKNTVLIMTSNLGAREIRGGKHLGFGAPSSEQGESDYKTMRAKVMDEVKKAFNPEFLNRIDDIVVFHSLGKPEMVQIIHILLDQVRQRLKEHDIELEMTPEAEEFLIEKGFDRAFGARPLKRAIQRHVEDPLAELVLRGKFKGPSRCQVRRNGDELAFEDVSARATKKTEEEKVGLN